MNNLKNYKVNLSLCIALLCLLFAGCANTSTKEVYQIKNDVLERNILCSKSKPGPVVVETFDSSGDKLASTDDAPYFELVINNKLITANDEVWVFQNNSTRQMGNGGIEHKLVFVGSSDVNGLEVILYQQAFPTSTLIREKLELQTSRDAKFRLNKLNGKLHFKFPQYGLVNAGTKAKATEIKLASWEHKPITFNEKGVNAKGNHMFYPVITETNITETAVNVKGPINIVNNGKIGWVTAYEHASQDDTNGLFKKQQVQGGNIVDAMQGVKGVFHFQSRDEDFKFLGISYSATDKIIPVSVDVVRGGYLDGEEINSQRPYSSVWTASAFYEGGNLDDGKAVIRNYLFNEICEKPASRKPEFYYNTWGMQREISRGKPHLLRGCFTYETIFKEIDRAAQLGVDLFVLDDGWEQTQGIWKPHSERLPQGLAPIKERLDQYGIKMGIWLSPMGIDSTTTRYKQHNNWVIKDSEGNPILAQWNHPAFDFVGPFFDVFIEDCKWLIDQGARFFKWDAINTFYSTLPNLYHGSDQYSEEEIRARYEYLLPIYVTRAMEILTDYEPELIIEMDVTEARRVMLGLAPISQGKLFFMNNGASWYNDYTSFRAMSMRTIANEYNGLFPLELFTYANYPQNLADNMHYNANNSLIAGHGFWGNLALMTDEERVTVGKKVKKSKRVLPYLTEVNSIIEGKVGDSPELYIQVNKEESAGQVFVFANEDVTVNRNIEVDEKKFLAALNNSYTSKDGSINLKFSLKGEASTCEAFILPNENTGISIVSSTSVIDDVTVAKGQLEYHVIQPGKQIIRWYKQNGEPIISGIAPSEFEMEKTGDYIKIKVTTSEQNQNIKITGK